MADESSFTPAPAPAGSATAEAADMFKKQVKASTDRLVGETKRAFADVRAAADERIEQGRDFIEHRPYQALGLGLLAGVLLGRLLGSGRPQVVYLKDKRF